MESRELGPNEETANPESSHLFVRCSVGSMLSDYFTFGLDRPLDTGRHQLTYHWFADWTVTRHISCITPLQRLMHHAPEGRLEHDSVLRLTRI